MGRGGIGRVPASTRGGLGETSKGEYAEPTPSQ